MNNDVFDSHTGCVCVIVFVDDFDICFESILNSYIVYISYFCFRSKILWYKTNKVT